LILQNISLIPQLQKIYSTKASQNKKMMNTIPPVNPQGHISNLVTVLRKYLPELNEEILLFFDAANCVVEDKHRVLRKNCLMETDEFISFFEKLCSEGRSWINLSGDSWFDGRFQVGIEYSKSIGSTATGIALSGPSIDVEGRALKHTNIVVS
jgi:hypothetical protein